MFEYFKLVFSLANEEQKNTLINFENEAKNKKSYLYYGNKWKIYDKLANEIKHRLIIDAKQKYNDFSKKDLENTSEFFLAIGKSKYNYFLNMKIKDKLKIKDYKKSHLKCEKNYNQGKITFIQEWK